MTKKQDIIMTGVAIASLLVGGAGVLVGYKAAGTAEAYKERCVAREKACQKLEAKQWNSTEKFIFSVSTGEFSPKTLARANRNLLNIRALADGKKWDGQIGVDKFNHVIFSHPSYSVRAGAIVLKNYERKHGIDTIEGLVTRFCESNHAEYISFLCKQLGVKPTQKISLTKCMGKILPAMIKFETGENVGLEYTKIIDAIVG